MDNKEKDKEKEKEKKKTSLKKLHKTSLKKFLIEETPTTPKAKKEGKEHGDQSPIDEEEKDKSKKTKKLSKKKLALQQQQQAAALSEKQQALAAAHQHQLQQNKLNVQKLNLINQVDEDDDDEDDEDYDDDESSDDETTTITATSIALTPKELYNNVINKQRVKYTKQIQFTPLLEAIQFAHDDPSHIIFIIHCVDWYFQSRNLALNIEQTFSKDKHVLYYFIDQTSLDYKKEFPGEIAGVPIISIYYRQKPFKIKRDTIQFDWDEQERIKASYTSHQLKELLDICKQAIESYHPDNNIDISIDF